MEEELRGLDEAVVLYLSEEEQEAVARGRALECKALVLSDVHQMMVNNRCRVEFRFLNVKQPDQIIVRFTGHVAALMECSHCGVAESEVKARRVRDLKVPIFKWPAPGVGGKPRVVGETSFIMHLCNIVHAINVTHPESTGWALHDQRRELMAILLEYSNGVKRWPAEARAAGVELQAIEHCSNMIEPTEEFDDWCDRCDMHVGDPRCNCSRGG